MNKMKLLAGSTIVLLIVNLALVGFIFLGKPPRPGDPDARKRIIIEKLGFDDAQVQEYERIIVEHRASMRDNNQKMRQLKNELYTTLNNGAPGSVKDSLILAISHEQISIENTHYTHFQNIKKICKQEQMMKFEELTDELATFFAPPRPQHPPRNERP
ncbi:MAG: periplasmic heavy metal sensor [Ignavibacteria bacterium]|nr:periplasmic heavy metal sensor [Ignavibacteria bacterium]